MALLSRGSCHDSRESVVSRGPVVFIRVRGIKAARVTPLRHWDIQVSHTSKVQNDRRNSLAKPWLGSLSRRPRTPPPSSMGRYRGMLELDEG